MRRKTGVWMVEQEVGGGGMVPTLTSIFIYQGFPGKELYGEQARGRECTSHQHCTVKSFCYILRSKGPWQIKSNATESQSAENEVSGNSFSCYNRLKFEKKEKNNVKSFPNFLWYSRCIPVTWCALKKAPCGLIVDTSSSIPQAKNHEKTISLEGNGNLDNAFSAVLSACPKKAQWLLHLRCCCCCFSA